MKIPEMAHFCNIQRLFRLRVHEDSDLGLRGFPKGKDRFSGGPKSCYRTNELVRPDTRVSNMENKVDTLGYQLHNLKLRMKNTTQAGCSS